MKLQDLDFRVWHLKKKKFLYKNDGVSLAIDTNSTNSYLMKGEISARILPIYKDKFLRDDKVHFNLWTGLYDKNGVKIFSDDLIVYDLRFYEVKNSSNFKSFLFRKNEKGVNTVIKLYKEIALECGVVGNIYENKEF